MPRAVHSTPTNAPQHTHNASIALATLTLVLSLFLPTGCASPGPPRPPSLNLPGPVNDLSALRHGDIVDIRFTIPQRNTDHLPLRGNTVKISLCRTLNTGACLALPLTATLPILTNNTPTTALLHDTLPTPLTLGAPRQLSYRVQLLNASNKTAGFSDPAFTLAGEAPAPVANLAATGSRLGTILSWQTALAADSTEESTVVIRREDLAPKSTPPPATPAPHAKSLLPTAARSIATSPTTVVLAAPQPDPSGKLLDTSVLLDDPYRYTAERRLTMQIGGRTLEARSEPSAPIVFILRDIYPPPAPTDFTAAAFPTNPSDPTSPLAVDLIWQPVDDPRLLGYIVYRQTLDANNTPVNPVQRLTLEPLRLPAFHDKLESLPTPAHLRYRITAIDAKGNESPAATTTIDATR